MKLFSLNSSQNSLLNLVKVQISLRIFFCVVLTFLIFIVISRYEILNSIKEQENKIEHVCRNLESFVVSQYLIGNERAAKHIIVIFNRDKNIHITWVDAGLEKPTKFDWMPILSWKYIYPDG